MQIYAWHSTGRSVTAVLVVNNAQQSAVVMVLPEMSLWEAQGNSASVSRCNILLFNIEQCV